MLVLLGLSSMVGLIVGEYKIFPYEHIRDAKRVLERALPFSEERRSESQVPSEIPTVFIRLKLRSLEVPLIVAQRGGGLTSFGKELLLVEARGGIFTINDEAAEKTRIMVPDNGYEEYTDASSMEKYKDYRFQIDGPRYNDILYYEEAGEHGLVISYTEYRPEKECYNTVVAHLNLPPGIDSLNKVEAAAEDWNIVYRTRPCLPFKQRYNALEGHMVGGRIGYRSPHKIILANGDYHWDGVYAPKAIAQLTGNDYGKVIEIDLIDQKAKHLSIGHRNTQGLLVDLTGQIWVTEHGPRGGDELNRIIDGVNFGWPIDTLGTKYSTLPWLGGGIYGRHDLFTKPTFAWVPSVGISNITQIAGFHPAWNGDFLAASLGARSLFRIRVHDNRVIFVEPIKIGERVRYVHQHTDGRIVLWTDDYRIIFISPSDTSYLWEIIETQITKADYDEKLKTRLRQTLEGCLECHSMEANDSVSSINLATVHGADIAGTKFAGYSEALLSKEGVWRTDDLIKFLTEPNAFAPGTIMPNPNIGDPVVVSKIVDILKKIKRAAEEKDLDE